MRVVGELRWSGVRRLVGRWWRGVTEGPPLRTVPRRPGPPPAGGAGVTGPGAVGSPGAWQATAPAADPGGTRRPARPTPPAAGPAPGPSGRAGGGPAPASAAARAYERLLARSAGGRPVLARSAAILRTRVEAHGKWLGRARAAVAEFYRGAGGAGAEAGRGDGRDPAGGGSTEPRVPPLSEVPYDLGHGLDDAIRGRQQEPAELVRRLSGWVRQGSAALRRGEGGRRRGAPSPAAPEAVPVRPDGDSQPGSEAPGSDPGPGPRPGALMARRTAVAPIPAADAAGVAARRSALGSRRPPGRAPGGPRAPRPRATATSWAAALVLAFAVGLWAGGAAFSQPPATPAAAPAPATPVPVRIIRSVPTSAKAIALTFDDGPSPKYTPMVLQLLQEYGAHATFFVIGQEVERYPQILKAEVDAGNEIGNHGYHHLTLKSVSTEQLVSEVQTAEQTLVSLTGSDPTLYRLPGGKSDPAALRQLADLGYKIVMWSVDTRDYLYRPPSAIIAQVEKAVAPGAIVIFHDGGGNQQHTVDALKVLLPWLKQQGYQMMTVSQLMAMPRATVTH